MSNIFYPQFYLQFGIRSIDRLSNPRVFNIENFRLPKAGIVHYLPTHAADMGPDETAFYLRNETVRPYVDNVATMAASHGNPRRKGAFNIENIKRKWLSSHRGFRRITDLTRALDDRSAAILANYALIPMQWRYLPLPLTRYYRFQNLLTTVYQQVKLYAENSARQQFILVQVPDELPSRMQLNVSVEDDAQKIPVINAFRQQQRNNATAITYGEMIDRILPGFSAELPRDVATEAFDESALGFESRTDYLAGSGVALEEMNRIRLGFFHNDDSLFIQDLWQWMSDKREESLLSIVPVEHLDKVNLVFLRMGKFTVLNLGYLNKWTKSEENQKGQGFSSITRHMLQHLTSIQLLTGITEQAVVEETLPDENGDSQVLAVNLPEPGEVQEAVDTVTDAEEPVVDQETQAAPPSEETVQQAQAETLSQKINRGQPGLRTQLIDAIKAASGEGEPAPTAMRLLNAPDVDAEYPIEPNQPEEETHPLIAGVEKRASRLLSKGLITTAEYRRHLRQAESFREMPSPFTEGETVEQFSKIPKELVWDFKPAEIAPIEHVKDKSMLKSTLIHYDRSYTENVMQKDVVNHILNLQRAGVAVTDIRVERRTDALNDLYDYTVKLSPVNGAPSTVRFQLPVIDKNGKFKVGGIKYYMRKLRYDKPIRKISESVVALSTYYGKLFVSRSERARDNYDTWLQGVFDAATEEKPPRVTEVVYGDSFTDSQPVPRTYSALAKYVLNFELKEMKLVFDYPNLKKNFPDYQDGQLVPVGWYRKRVLTMDANGHVNCGSEQFGHIANLLGGNANRRPNELVFLSVLGEEFPLAIVLMYLQGLSGMVAEMEIQPQRRMKGTRADPDANSFELVFADEVWRIPRIPHADTLIYASLLHWKDVLKNYSVLDLDNPDNFNALLSDRALSGRYLYEFQNLHDLFIDPIARENLEAMQEPTEFIPLLKKAAFYLVTDEYPSDLSSDGALFKGYERMTGAVYRALIDGVRRYSSQTLGSKATVDFPPFQILSDIQSDPSVGIVEDSNPIHNLKEKENVTYSGTGGRSKRSMVRRTRAFHPSDIGIRSEAGVDNGDVGINCFLTANPNLTSLRGTAETEQNLDPKNGIGNILSTSALVSPFATYDDPKRVNFINIQRSHEIQAKDSDALPISTGYESVMAHRTDDMFSSGAKGPGVIAEKGKNYVVVKYDDPALGEDRIELGRKFGIVTGHTVPHEIVCDLAEGTRVDSGDIVAFHPGFYKRDWRNLKQVRLKQGIIAKIVLMENNNTFEDASLISQAFSERLETVVTHTRTLMVEFNSAIRNLVSEGQHVDSDDILAYIEDEISATYDYFDESTMETLKRLGNPAPRAKHLGKVEKIEVFYFGEKEDMSDSLRKIADKYDAVRAKTAKVLGNGAAVTGQVLTPSRIDGQPLEIDMMAIRIYITHERGMGDGDKIVVGNQKKSVVSGVFQGVCRTAGPVLPGGQPWDLDLQFSYRAINARIVNSALLLGMGNILIENIQQQMLQAYDNA